MEGQAFAQNQQMDPEMGDSEKSYPLWDNIGVVNMAETLITGRC